MNEPRSKLHTNPFAAKSERDPFFWHTSALEQNSRLLNALAERRKIMVLCGEQGIGKTSFLHQIEDQCADQFEFALIEQASATFEKLGALILASTDSMKKVNSVNPPVKFSIGEFLPACEDSGQPVIVLKITEPVDTSLLDGIIRLDDSRAEPACLFILSGPESVLPSLRAWSDANEQAITCWCRLDRLIQNDTGKFIQAYLETADFEGRSPFTRQAIRRIHHYAGGHPNITKNICGVALVNSGLENLAEVSASLIDEVADTCMFTPITEAALTANSAIHPEPARTPPAILSSATSRLPGTASSDQYRKLGIPEPSKHESVQQPPKPSMDYRSWKALFKRG